MFEFDFSKKDTSKKYTEADIKKMLEDTRESIISMSATEYSEYRCHSKFELAPHFNAYYVDSVLEVMDSFRLHTPPKGNDAAKGPEGPIGNAMTIKDVARHKDVVKLQEQIDGMVTGGFDPRVDSILENTLDLSKLHKKLEKRVADIETRQTLDRFDKDAVFGKMMAAIDEAKDGDDLLRLLRENGV